MSYQSLIRSSLPAVIVMGMLSMASAQQDSAPPDAGIPASKPATQLPPGPGPGIQPERNSAARQSGVDVLPTPTVNPGFGIPDGLKTPARRLFHDLGYGSEVAFPLTPVSCFDAAYKCYSMGLLEDSLAFVNHGLKMCNHARLYLLKSMIEIDLKRPDDATNTLVKFRHAVSRPMETYGMQTAVERLNGPARVRADILLTAWQNTP